MKKNKSFKKVAKRITKTLMIILAHLMIGKAYIRKTPGKREWCVYAESGRRMGCYPSKKKAKERLRQIEYFKHVKSTDKFIRIKDLVENINELFNEPY